MPIPSVITDLSATAASNSPSGSDAPSTLDDIQRAHGAFIRQLYDLVASASGSLSSSAYSTGNLTYTGTLTGGTGVVNIGSGQIYKDASGNFGVGTTPAGSYRLSVDSSTSDNIAYFRGANYSGQVLRLDAYSGVLRLEATNALALGAAGSERFRVKTTGQFKTAPLSSAPSGAEEGDVYYDSTTKKHYGYNGTAWQAMY